MLLSILLVMPASPHPKDPSTVARALHALVEQEAITQAMHTVIEQMYRHGTSEALLQYIQTLAARGQITGDTLIYLKTLLEVGVDSSAQVTAPAQAAYTGNGNVTKLGELNPRAPFVYFGDNSSTGQLYEGIWGYAAAGREYALLTHSQGLTIIDVTNPVAPVALQFIPGVGGRVHHDVDTHYDATSGKTYAYFGGQEGERLYSIDLSYLPGVIPASGIVDLGRTNYAHTLQVKDGLLFTNNAGSTLGCQIFDLPANPANPPLLAQSWSGTGRDCHDSFLRNNILYSADGYSTRWRIVDVTGIRSGFAPQMLGETAAKTGVYAHSNWPTDDGRYLFTFDESNLEDINVFDVSNPANPVNIKTFQWSGDGGANSRVHNGQIRGNLLHVAYYEAGYRVFDVSDPANPVEVGKYETWRDPDGDGTFNKPVTGNYNGAWNVYTGLPSGYVLVSDMYSGLFVFQVTSPVPQPPSAPAGLTAVAGNAQVALSWTASSGATSYNVKRSTASGGPYVTVASGITSTGYTNTGLVNGTTYYYVVTAVNAAGESSNSNQASATPFGADTVPPSQPGGLSATPGPGTKQLSLAWTPSSDNVGVSAYEVWRATKQNSGYSLIGTTTTTSFIDTLAKSGQTRWYYVVARDAAGNRSAASAKVLGTAK